MSDIYPLDLVKLAQLVGVSEAALVVALCRDDTNSTDEQGPTPNGGGFEGQRSGESGSGGAGGDQRRASCASSSSSGGRAPRGVALVTAARRAPSKIQGEFPMPKELLVLGKHPLIVHALMALEKAGVGVAVILLGHRGQEIVQSVQKTSFKMQINFVDLGDDWKGETAATILFFLFDFFT